MASPLPPAEPETILFRPAKKRKIYRQRPTKSRSPSPQPASPTPQSLDELIASGSADIDVEGTSIPISEILRLRKLRKGKLGVEFRADGASHQKEDESAGAVVLREEHEEGGLEGVPRKFAPQTGTVGDVNKHMMAYIDSELAKRRAAEGAVTTSSNTNSSKPLAYRNDEAARKDEVQRQPAALGKLLEIDLGDEARNRNVERTDKARRRLGGEEVEEEVEGTRKPAKIRLGRDGKPWRGRKRRGSDDVKRDKLVEDVLRENRLEIYDEPEVESPNLNDDQAADDRIAEAFRKEFMDAVSQRQRKKTAPAPPPARGAGGKKEEEVLKGPKLGGSRSARAAMRETMLKSAKK